MSSIHETFAPDSDFTPVGRKKSNYKSRSSQPFKPAVKSIDSNLAPVAKSIDSETVFVVKSIDSEPAPVAKSIDSQPVLVAKSIDSDNTAGTAATASSSRGPRKPPSGLFVNLGKEWKEFVRKLIPNKSAKTSDETVMNEISKVKTNPQVTNFEFKKIVCMIFHQALKTDRNSLVDKIINCWTRSGYNIVELIDSTYDGCKPMTQACWSGSIYCIQRLIAADLSGSVLYTVHPTKNETILDTLLLGKNYAITKEPDTALFAADRFDKCEKFIKAAMARHEASQKESESSVSNSSISLEIKESIDRIIEEADGSNDSIVNQLVLKLVDLYLEDQEKSAEYFGAVKIIVGAEVFNQIDSRLKDEGIEFN